LFRESRVGLNVKVKIIERFSKVSVCNFIFTAIRANRITKIVAIKSAEFESDSKLSIEIEVRLRKGTSKIVELQLLPKE
jgi:hypothetical protein